MRGPEYFNTNLSFFKNLPVPWRGTRAARVQLRLEAFNVFNKAHLAITNPSSSTASATFGQVTALRSGRDPRVVQLGARFIF